VLTTKQNRLDPSMIGRTNVERLVAAFARDDHATLIDKDGNRTELPQALSKHLLRILRMMQEGRAIIMLPEDEAFTTQAAANFLGVSRQFFVDLLEKGEIPFHPVGAHRRVYFKDLLEYQKRRDGSRAKVLDDLATEVHRTDLYFPKPKPGRS
jgi:excisionase family DNA binding protein